MFRFGEKRRVVQAIGADLAAALFKPRRGLSSRVAHRGLIVFQTSGPDPDCYIFDPSLASSAVVSNALGVPDRWVATLPDGNLVVEVERVGQTDLYHFDVASRTLTAVSENAAPDRFEAAR